MANNQELQDVRALLQEASTEIPAKLDELLAQVGDAADPALVAEIKGLAGNLAGIVPNVPVDETLDPEPVEDAPVDEAPTPE